MTITITLAGVLMVIGAIVCLLVLFYIICFICMVLGVGN